MNSKNICESVILKSNCVVVFVDTYPKLPMPSDKLSSALNRQNKSVTSDLCYSPNPDNLHSPVSNSDRLYSMVGKINNFWFPN